MGMKTTCYRCSKPATRFFISLMQHEPGIDPKDRAVCAACSTRGFDEAARIGWVKEVPQDEWEQTKLCREVME